MLKILLSNWNVLFFGVIKGLSLKLLKLNDLSNLFFEKENNNSFDQNFHNKLKKILLSSNKKNINNINDYNFNLNNSFIPKFEIVSDKDFIFNGKNTSF